MAVKKRVATPTYSWLRSGTTELSPAEQVAHDILTERRDLMPSVERIMNAGLGADGTLRAIGLFRDALTTEGDVHRDPRVAIATCMPEGGPIPTDD